MKEGCWKKGGGGLSDALQRIVTPRRSRTRTSPEPQVDANDRVNRPAKSLLNS